MESDISGANRNCRGVLAGLVSESNVVSAECAVFSISIAVYFFLFFFKLKSLMELVPQMETSLHTEWRLKYITLCTVLMRNVFLHLLLATHRKTCRIRRRCHKKESRQEQELVLDTLQDSLMAAMDSQ